VSPVRKPGRPRSGDPEAALVTISIRLSASLLELIDKEAAELDRNIIGRRSAVVRRALERVFSDTSR
jgi:hypothetical protein